MNTHTRYLVLLFSSIVLALALYLFLSHEEDNAVPLLHEKKTPVYDIEKYPTWRDLMNAMHHDAAKAQLDPNGELILQNGSKKLKIEMNIFSKCQDHYYIHFTEKGYMFCRTDSPLCYMNENESSWFYYTYSVTNKSWNNIENLRLFFEKNDDTCFSLSADDNFRLKDNWRNICILFHNLKKQQFYEFVYKTDIIPKTEEEKKDAS